MHVATPFRFFLVAIGIWNACVETSVVPLELLTEYSLAKCLDGTPGGFYHQAALDPASQDKWVIHLQGPWQRIKVQHLRARL